MGNAAIGATVRVKLSDGKVLQGKALSEGRVEAVLD
jgi:flagella basal body P-ring formation protein FlgA